MNIKQLFCWSTDYPYPLIDGNFNITVAHSLFFIYHMFKPQCHRTPANFHHNSNIHPGQGLNDPTIYWHMVSLPSQHQRNRQPYLHYHSLNKTTDNGCGDYMERGHSKGSITFKLNWATQATILRSTYQHTLPVWMTWEDKMSCEYQEIDDEC